MPHSVGLIRRRLSVYGPHVRSGIWTDEAPNWACQTNEAAQALVTPSTTVVEFPKYLRSWSMIGHDPEGDQEGEKGKDVHEQYDAFSQRKMVSTEDVEPDRQESKCEDQERDLPRFHELRVRVSHSYLKGVEV